MRTKSSAKESKLYTKVKRMGAQWMINAGISVNVEEWNKAQSSSRNLQKYFSTDAGKKVQEQMNLVEATINDFFL